MNRPFLALLAVGLLAAAGGYFAAMQLGSVAQPPPPAQTPGPDGLAGQVRPDFVHSDLSGEKLSADDLDGSIWLVNFWATWCEPCVEEMPMLSALQVAYAARGFRVVGIALDDPGRAAGFAAGLDLSYPVLLGEADVVLTGRRYGNATGMLPYSVLVDREGRIRWSRLGVLDRNELEQEVEALLAVD